MDYMHRTFHQQLPMPDDVGENNLAGNEKALE